jgi:AAA domain
MNSALDRPLDLTIFPTGTAFEKIPKRVSLRKLAKAISTREAASKDKLPWLKLGRFGDVKTAKGSYRSNANLQQIDGVEVDYDGGSISVDKARATLDLYGVAALCYESASSTVEAPRFRVLCPTSKTLEPNKREGLVERLNGIFEGQLDQQASFTLSQSFYFGGVTGQAKPKILLCEGDYIDLAKGIEPRPKSKSATVDGEYESDGSGSGAAFRKAMTLQLAGEAVDAFEAWAVDNPWRDYEANPERAIERTWDRAEVQAGKIALEKLHVEPVEFDDLGPETDAKPKSRKSTLKDLDLANLETANGSTEFVEGVFAADSFSCVYGAPSAGKTFFLLDLALHVACNRPWNGLGVEQSGVIYVALEGAGGFSKRLKAWCQHYGVTDLADLPFHAMVGSFDMRNDKSTTRDIVETAKAKAALWGKPVRLIVIDTLARAMAGGDENSAQDMGAVVAIADSIRLATGANVCLVHHSGKDDSRGARGSNALLGAVDTEIRVDRDGLSRTATVKKQKDGQEGDSFDFKLETVDFGLVNKWGKPVTSCVPVAAVPASFDPVEGLNERQRTAYQILEKGIQEGGRSTLKKGLWRTMLSSALWMESGRSGRKADDETPSDETFKRKFREVVKDLETQGFIAVEGDHVSLSH